MNFPTELITHSPADTEEIGRSLAQAIIDADLPRFVAMYGDLGVGKTAFVRGFCSVLCPASTVKSPTFALVNEYRCTSEFKSIKKVCHFDMYRVTDEDDLYSIGFYDYLDGKNLCITEWSENIEDCLPDRYIRVEIIKNDPSSPDSREIRISEVK